jgi:hypothetical protein
VFPSVISIEGRKAMTADSTDHSSPVISAGSAPALIDEVMPAFDHRVRREVVVQTSTAQAYTAILTTDLTESRLLRLLQSGGAWPGRWHGDLPDAGRPPLRLTDLRRFGLLVLAERPNRGLALGAIVRLWSVRPMLQRIPPDYFASSTKPGFSRVAATIEVKPVDCGVTLLSCEARFLTPDRSARRRFRFGWPFGRILVAIVEREALRVIRRHARRGAPSAGYDG